MGQLAPGPPDARIDRAGGNAHQVSGFVLAVAQSEDESYRHSLPVRETRDRGRDVHVRHFDGRQPLDIVHAAGQVAPARPARSTNRNCPNPGTQLLRISQLPKVAARLEKSLLGDVLGIAARAERPRKSHEVGEQRLVSGIEPLGVDHRPHRYGIHTTVVCSGAPSPLHRTGTVIPFSSRPRAANVWHMHVHDAETERIRRIYDRRADTSAAPKGDANLRWLCGQASGETLEIGIGRGRTLSFYPPGIRLSAIELSGVALETARRRAAALDIHATFHHGDAAALPYPDDHFDTVIFSFVLCTIPDDRKAVSEAVRVLCPGGRLLLLEHVRSPNRVVRGLEHLIEPIELRRMGDHLLREPLDHVLAEGLEIETLERSWFGVLERLAARKPEADELEEAV